MCSEGKVELLTGNLPSIYPRAQYVNVNVAPRSISKDEATEVGPRGGLHAKEGIGVEVDERLTPEEGTRWWQRSVAGSQMCPTGRKRSW